MSRIYKFPVYDGSHAALKLNIRKKSALNMALALATSEEELKLIKVNQKLYPIHLIEKSCNNFLLAFNNGFHKTMPGRMHGSARPGWVGPSYTSITWWSPLPVYKEYDETLIDAYKLLEDIKNGRTNGFWGEEELNLAGDLIRRKAVVM